MPSSSLVGDRLLLHRVPAGGDPRRGYDRENERKRPVQRALPIAGFGDAAGSRGSGW